MITFYVFYGIVLANIVISSFAEKFAKAEQKEVEQTDENELKEKKLVNLFLI
jgi:flagellar motor component MotA